MTARGIRNNNPGNLEYNNYTRSLGATGSDGRFAIFPTMADGICALAKNLRNYYQKPDGKGGRIDTVREAINRWAPSNENNTSAYVLAVAQLLEVDPDAELNFDDADTLYWMTVAIGEHECGHDEFSHGVSEADLNAGVNAALA